MGAGHGEERTRNMWTMDVTLEVSKVSGWLNADAPCRESQGGHTVRGEVWPGRRERGGRPRCTQRVGEGSTADWGQGTGHVKHAEHVRDAGGVEAQRLVERRRELPRVGKRAYGAGGGVAREAGARRATAVHAAHRGGLDCRLGAGHGAGRTKNIRSMVVVTLEVSKLSGWLNTDADCRESKGGHAVRGEVRARRREAAGDHGARRVQGRARMQIGSRVRGGAHLEYAAHARDAGGVEAQRLVERRRALPNRTEGTYGAGRGCGPADGATASSVQWRLDCRYGAGHGEERTMNIWYMVVTLEVSQLETSASKFFKSLKSPPMSVMPETPQRAMGPYVAMAVVGLALYASTAVFREALVVNVAGQVPGPQLEP